MQQPSPSPAILYESSSKTIVLIDIPASLSAPPGLAARCLHQPLAIPYTLAEPKVQTAFSQELSLVHSRLRSSLLEALEDVQQHYKGPYSHSRAPPSQHDDESSQELDFHANISFLQSPNSTEEPMVLENDMAFSDISDILSLPIISSSDNWTALTISHPHPPKRFHIPPNSSFLLSSFQSSALTFTALSKQLERFHFILLDPPWPNRSASRSSVYSTLSRFEMKDLLRLPLGDALTKPESCRGRGHTDTGEDRSRGSQDGGFVGIWITNKPKFRAYVLETLFPSWRVEPVGEWVWLKITTTGEPMFDLESSMRKPYEILLFGQRTSNSSRKKRKRKREVDGDEEHAAVLLENPSDGMTTAKLSVIPRKTILAVPDLHSRKPCIKELIEPYLPQSYRGCEIFGRNLIEGWLTWGDEAIKFNWEGHWKEEEENRVYLTMQKYS